MVLDVYLSTYFRTYLFIWGLVNYARGDTVVVKATRYGLYGPGIESICGRDFLHPSKSSLGTTQPPVRRVRDLFFFRGKAAGTWR